MQGCDYRNPTEPIFQEMRLLTLSDMRQGRIFHECKACIPRLVI